MPVLDTEGLRVGDIEAVVVALGVRDALAAWLWLCVCVTVALLLKDRVGDAEPAY